MTGLRRQLLFSQLSFCALLAVCALVLPRVATSEGGVSNFGNRSSTLPLYVASFLFCVFGLMRAAGTLRRLGTGLRLEARMLELLALLDVFVLVSTFPRRISWTYSVVHDDLGIALFAYEFIVGIVLVRWMPRSTALAASLLFAVQLLGEVLALLTVEKVIHLLFWAQAIETLGFAALLVLAVPAVAARRLAGS